MEKLYQSETIIELQDGRMAGRERHVFEMRCVRSFLQSCNFQ